VGEREIGIDFAEREGDSEICTLRHTLLVIPSGQQNCTNRS
jgi:hypothetical protein